MNYMHLNVNNSQDSDYLDEIWPKVDRELFNHKVTPLPALSREEKIFICKIYAIGYEAGYNEVIKAFNDVFKNYYKG